MTNRKEAEQMVNANEIKVAVSGLVEAKAIGEDDRLVATVLLGALYAGAEQSKIVDATGLTANAVAPVFQRFADSGVFTTDGKVATEFVGHDGASAEDESAEFLLLVCVGQGYVKRK